MASDFLSYSYAQEMSSLLQQIQLTSANLASRDETENENARVQALEAAKKLVAALEKPEEMVMRYAFEVLVRRSVASHPQLTWYRSVGITSDVPSPGNRFGSLPYPCRTEWQASVCGRARREIQG